MDFYDCWMQSVKIVSSFVADALSLLTRTDREVNQSHYSASFVYVCSLLFCYPTPSKMFDKIKLIWCTLGCYGISQLFRMKTGFTIWLGWIPHSRLNKSLVWCENHNRICVRLRLLLCVTNGFNRLTTGQKRLSWYWLSLEHEE